LAALTIGLSTSTAVAQNGSNFLLRSNGADAIFGGVGAGVGSVPGVGGDGVGVWMCYEGMRGNSVTQLGDFGYKQIAWREAVCVLGAPIVGLGLKFPQITVLEYDGVNPFGSGNVFTMPVCGVPFGCFPLGNSAGIAPYGTPAGSSASFLLTGFTTGVGLPSNAIAVIPNNGLVPSSAGGTAFVIAVASGTLGIASTGFCWGVQFGWLPSALPSLDDVNGWWMWRSNSQDNNQYWNLSDDETNIWQTQTVLSTAGGTALFALNANFEYDNDWLSSNASTNVALAPVGANGTGVYYGTGAGVPNSGNSVNGGFDMGRHGGISTSGTGGTVSSLTGLGGQDPAGSPTAGLIPTMGAVTWSNGPSTTIGGGANFHLDWIQIWFDLTFGVDPALTTDLTVGPGGIFRVPVTLQASFPGGFPQPLTTAFFPFFIHAAADQTGVAAWPDPFGFGGGTFGIPPIVGSSFHLPVATSSVAVGLPVGLQAGTSRLKTAGGPFLWKGGPNANTPSQTHGIPLID
jgi:hypothetical protein